MRPVKTHKPRGRPTAERLAEVCAVLGPVGKKLPLAWLADLARVPRSTLKNAASRDSLSYDVAWQIAGLFDDDRAATVEWLRKGTRRAPSRPRMDSAGSSETQSVGVITQRPDRAERLAGIGPRGPGSRAPGGGRRDETRTATARRCTACLRLRVDAQGVRADARPHRRGATVDRGCEPTGCRHHRGRRLRC